MLTISNINLKDKQIYIIKNKNNYQIIGDFMGVFNEESLGFSLKKTFENYENKLFFKNNQWIIEIPLKYSFGEILKHFYLSVYNKWMYY